MIIQTKSIFISSLAIIAVLFISNSPEPTGFIKKHDFSNEKNVQYSAVIPQDYGDRDFSADQHSLQISGINDISDSSEYVDYFASNGFGKPVSTMQHPAGEYFDGVTYLAYQGPHEDPYVCAYHHATGEWSGPVQAGVSVLGHNPSPTDPNKIDNHGRPALIIDNEGYIHLFFGGHGGRKEFGSNPLGRHGKGKQTHVISKNPGDISSWEILDNISPFGTYSQLVKMPNGDIFLFYRHGSHRSDWVYQKSTDNARSFSNPVSILKHKPQSGNPTVYDTWYAWFQAGPENTIFASFNYHPCSNPGHSSIRFNAYIMKMNTECDCWENIGGERLSMALTKESADAMTLIIPAKDEKTRLGTIKVDKMGKSHQYFRHSGKLKYYQWNEKNQVELKTLDQHMSIRDADILINDMGTIRVLSVVANDQHEELCWWESRDEGDSWEKEDALISATNVRYSMSSLIRNAHPDARFLLAEIPDNPTSVTSKLYLFGDSGPVRRKASEISEQ